MRRASNENSVSIGSRTIRRNFPSLLLGLFALMLGACTTSGMGGGELSRPGKPDESILLYRMTSSEPGVMMPEMGRNTTHQEGVELIRAWIASMQGTCDA